MVTLKDTWVTVSCDQRNQTQRKGAKGPRLIEESADMTRSHFLNARCSKEPHSWNPYDRRGL